MPMLVYTHVRHVMDSWMGGFDCDLICFVDKQI